MTVETRFSLSKDTLAALQSLIRENIDSSAGLRDVGDHITDVAISKVFHQLAVERDRQAGELRTLVLGSDEDPADTGTLAGAAHRVWIDLRAAAGAGPDVLLSEALRGEDFLLEKYREAAAACAASPVADVLQRHLAAVQAAHDRLRALREQIPEQAGS